MQNPGMVILPADLWGCPGHHQSTFVFFETRSHLCSPRLASHLCQSSCLLAGEALLVLLAEPVKPHDQVLLQVGPAHRACSWGWWWLNIPFASLIHPTRCRGPEVVAAWPGWAICVSGFSSRLFAQGPAGLAKQDKDDTTTPPGLLCVPQGRRCPLRAQWVHDPCQEAWASTGSA